MTNPSTAERLKELQRDYENGHIIGEDIGFLLSLVQQQAEALTEERETLHASERLRAKQAEALARVEQERDNDPLKNLRAAKYLNGMCCESGCQWLQAEACIAALEAENGRLESEISDLEVRLERANEL